MLAMNIIFEELKDAPLNKLEELKDYVNSLIYKKKEKRVSKEEILSFSGIFSEFSEKEFQDFKRIVAEERTEMFERKFEI